MPVIVSANTKGGSGKSTTAIVLGTTFALLGASVRIIDCDPQGTNLSWSRGDSKYRDIVISPAPGEDLTDLIDRLASEYQFVIIDVQGSANQEISASVSRADLVVIPTRGATADAEVAPKTIELLGKQEKLFRKKIPRGVLFIATNPAIATREEKKLRKDVTEAGIPCFKTDLNQRTAFSHIYCYKLALDELDPKETNGIDAAMQNARTLANEIVDILRSARESQEVA